MTSPSARRPTRSSPRTRALLGGATVCLVGSLAACGADSASGNDLVTGRTDAAQAEARTTVSAGAGLGGMNQQAAELAASLPQFQQLTEALQAPATPVARATSTSSTGSAVVGALDGCAVVSNDLLADSLGLQIPTPPQSQASAYGDPNATDCIYASTNAIVVVRATTVASTDLSDQAVTNALKQTGTFAIAGATRGYAYVPAPSASSGAAVVKVVVGERGVSVALTAAQPVTGAQATELGLELVSALQ